MLTIIGLLILAVGCTRIIQAMLQSCIVDDKVFRNRLALIVINGVVTFISLIVLGILFTMLLDKNEEIMQGMGKLL